MKSFRLLPLFLLLLACENKEEPALFKVDAEPAYAFSETANTAAFSITSNIPWEATLTNGGDWCRITPAAAKGDGKVEITVTANTAYLQERTAAIVVKADEFSHEITVTQAPPPCPAFNAGSIAATGQTLFTGGTPATIHSVQDATGAGTVTYQWYKDAVEISGATAANYTPPPADANTVGAHTYTRRAKDNICNTTFMPSAGSWVLTLVCDFNAGAIAATGQITVTGGTPATINSIQDAVGTGEIAYQWYKNGTAINGATAANYTPPLTDAVTTGATTYTRCARENTCNTTFMQSASNWILTVTDCNFNPGAIATSGQTVTINGTPAIINNTQAASGGDGVISYQWHKNGAAIDGATAANYTPPLTDAVTIGATTYTRYAKDNTCNTTLTLSAGSWALTVICGFDAGAIDPAGQTIVKGGTPATIHSAQNANGGDGVISYQWYKDGVDIGGATAASYTPPPADASAIGAHTYTRRAKDNTCNTELTQSEGSWVLTVVCDFNAGAIATAVQTIIIGSTPVTINSAQDATGNGTISYQWYKNDILINGATAAYYTPPQADANTVGANTYTRRAKDNTCQTAFTQSAGSWVLTVFCPAFDAGAIATDGQTICSGGAVNTITSSADASGGDGNITYQWRRNGATVGSAATYTPTAYNTTVGAHTFTRWAHDGRCNTAWTQSAGSWTLVVTANAQLTLTAGTNTLYVANGAAIAPIKYSTVNTSSVTVTGLPAGITYDWTDNTITISGSSTVTGTHSFIVAATGASGCGNTYASGSILIYPVGVDGYGCVPSNINLGTVGFASTVTHVVSGPYGSQTWSAPVIATYCDKTTFNGYSTGRPAADCRNNTEASYGHLLSWCMVVQYAADLCNPPWRVPTPEDYIILRSNLCNGYCNGANLGAFIYSWGGALGGTASADGMAQTGTAGWYCPDHRDDPSYAHFFANNAISGGNVAVTSPTSGLTLRCIKHE
jgi:hypothetical protein